MGAVDDELLGLGVVADERVLLAVIEDLETGEGGGARAQVHADVQGGALSGLAEGGVARRDVGVRSGELLAGALRLQGGDGLSGQAQLAVHPGQSHLAHRRHGGAPGGGGQVAHVGPVAHPAHLVALAVGGVIPGDGRVVVLAVVQARDDVGPGEGLRVRLEDLVDHEVAPVLGVAVAVLDDEVGLATLVGRHVHARPLQGPGVVAGGGGDDLAVHDEVDGGVVRDGGGLLVRGAHLVQEDVSPASGGRVGDDDLGGLALEIADVPALPVELLQVAAGGRAHHLAVNDQLDDAHPGAPVGAALGARVVAAAHEEVEVGGVDGEGRRGRGAGGGIRALPGGGVEIGVVQPGAGVVDQRLLAGGGALRWRGPEGVALHGPALPGAVEAGQEPAAAVVAGGLRVVGVLAAGGAQVDVGRGDRELIRGQRAGVGVAAAEGVHVGLALVAGQVPGGRAGAEGGAVGLPTGVAVLEVGQGRALLTGVVGDLVGGEGGAVPAAHEVLGGVGHRDHEDPLDLLGAAVDRQREEVRALPHRRGDALPTEAGLLGPVDEVGGGVEGDPVLGGVGDHHGPAPGGLVPEHLRVAELLGADVQDRVPVVVQVPGAALVRGVGQGLGLVAADVGPRPHRDHGRVVWAAQAGGVLGVDDRRSGEHPVLRGVRDRHPQLLPVDQVLGDGVAPGHVAPVRALGVVLVEHVVLAVVVDESVGVVHPVLLGGVVALRAPPLTGLVGLRRRRCGWCVRCGGGRSGLAGGGCGHGGQRRGGCQQAEGGQGAECSGGPTHVVLREAGSA